MSAESRSRAIRDLVAPDEPGVVCSLPCPRCGDAPDRSCARCAGAGVELWRVPAAQAAWDAERLREHHRA